MLVVLCTAPDAEVGATLARGIVENRLAACVNLVDGVRSFYRWDGAVQDEREVQLVIKTTAVRFDALAAWVDEHHPYDVPELIALPIERGAEAYLAWVGAQTS